MANIVNTSPQAEGSAPKGGETGTTAALTAGSLSTNTGVDQNSNTGPQPVTQDGPPAKGIPKTREEAQKDLKTLTAAQIGGRKNGWNGEDSFEVTAQLIRAHNDEDGNPVHIPDGVFEQIRKAFDPIRLQVDFIQKTVEPYCTIGKATIEHLEGLVDPDGFRKWLQDKAKLIEPEAKGKRKNYFDVDG